MRRKVIKQGHNTLTVTLPSKWAKEKNIRAGDEVNLSEKEEGLLINIEKLGDRKKAEFNISDIDVPTIWKYFMGVYREGYDEVKVHYKNKKMGSPYKYYSQHKLDPNYDKILKDKSTLQFLHDLMNRFIGFEIMDYGKDYVIIKDMEEPTTKEFENSLRRIFLLIQQMTEDTFNALKSGKFDSLSHIHNIDINLDKFHDYCIRILNKIGNKTKTKTSLLFSTLAILELIGDEFKNISHHLIQYSKKVKFSHIHMIVEGVKKQLDLFFEIFYNFDKKKLLQISEIDKEIYANVSTIYKKTKSDDEKEIFHHLRMITRYMNTLTELRIQLEF